MTHSSAHSGIPIVDSLTIIRESKTRLSCWVLLKVRPTVMLGIFDCYSNFERYSLASLIVML